jgi:hypothetical protein
VNEVQKAESRSVEILLASPIDATWNAVITENTLTFGPGNDGATSGHNAKVLNIVPDRGRFLAYFLRGYTSLIENSLYIEIVNPPDRDLPEVVQLRDGPEITSQLDYIPYDVKVQRVIEAEGDLLEWEKTAEGFTKGDVVYHPEGSMSSHYAVHAKINGTPVITTAKPRIGQVIRKNLDRKPRVTSAHKLRFARLISQFLMGRVENPQHSLSISMAALHNYAAWDLSRETDRRALALGIASIGKVACALLAGEMRHWGANGPGIWSSKNTLPKELNKLKTKTGSFKKRHQVYDTFLKRSIRYCLPALFPLTKGFDLVGWGASFGGSRWAECGKTTISFFTTLANFLTSRKTEDLIALCREYNMLVNMVHNGGKFFNKLISERVIDTIAELPVVGLVNSTMYEMLYKEINLKHYPRNTANFIRKVFEEGRSKDFFPVFVEPDESDYDPDSDYEEDDNDVEVAKVECNSRAKHSNPIVGKIKGMCAKPFNPGPLTTKHAAQLKPMQPEGKHRFHVQLPYAQDGEQGYIAFDIKGTTYTASLYPASWDKKVDSLHPGSLTKYSLCSLTFCFSCNRPAVSVNMADSCGVSHKIVFHTPIYNLKYEATNISPVEAYEND